MYDELIGKLQWLRQSFLDGNADGGKIEEKFDRVILVAETLQRNDSAWQRNVKEAWAALGLIRDVVETLGPVGAIASGEHTACTPSEKSPPFIREAEELVKGIRKIVDQAGGVKCIYERIDEAVEALITAMKAGRLEPGDADELSETLREYARRSCVNGKGDMPSRLLTDTMKKTRERLITFNVEFVDFRPRKEERRKE